MAITCQRCGACPATIHVTELQPQGGHAEAHLCPNCCQEAGWDGERDPPPLATLLAKPASAGAAAATDQTSACPTCGLTFAEYQQINLFGCPACYQAHDRAVFDLIRRWHGADRHIGRKPGAAVIDTRQVRRSELEARLLAAVTEERYEDAARLRDELRRGD